MIYGRLAFDLDGVVTDIAASLLKEIEGRYDSSCVAPSLFSPDSPSYLDDVFQNPLFWRNLKPIKDSWHKINEWFYGGFDIFFITARRSDASIGEIETWLDGWRIPFTKVFVCDQMQKHEVLKTIDPLVFIDDNPFEIDNIQRELGDTLKASVMKTWYNHHLITGMQTIDSLIELEMD